MLRNVVQRAQQCAGIENRHHAVRAVGAAVLNDLAGNRGHAAIVLHAGLQIDDGARAPAMRPENFLARVGDLHRRFGRARRDRRDDLQRNDLALAAEAAADQRLDHADLRHRHLQHQRELVLQVVRDLRGRPHGQPAQLAGVRIEFEVRQRAVRLHRGMRHFVGDVARLGT